MYLKRSTQGGLATVLVLMAMVVMFFVEVRQYVQNPPAFTFNIDDHLGHMMQMNVDITVATPCSSTCQALTELRIDDRFARCVR